MTKISGLTPAVSLDGTEEFPFRRGGTNGKATAPQIAASSGGLQFYVDNYLTVLRASATRTQVTTAINAAIAACYAAGGGNVILGVGNYFTNDQVIEKPLVNIIGQGQAVTVLDFLPTEANKAAILLSAGASAFGPARVSNLTIYSSNTSFVKFGILSQDGRNVELDHVQISGVGSGGAWHDTSNASVGIYLQGRDSYNVHDITSYADIPFKLAVNPNLANAVIDQSHFWNIIIYSGVSSLVQIGGPGAGGVVNNMTWDGFQEWLGGTTGLSWIDTSSVTLNSAGNVFKNIRLEQAVSATAWSFDIEGNSAANVYIGVTFENITGGDRKGWKLRNAMNVTLADLHWVDALLVGYDIDSSVYGFEISNSFWINGTTATVSGQTLVGEIEFGVASVTNLDASQTVPSNATYQNSSGLIPSGTFGGLTLTGSVLSTNTAAAASPAAGKVSVWTDSTDLRLHDKNSAGAIGTTIVADTGASNNFLTAISAAGVISKAQPSVSNLSGFGTGVATALGLNVGSAGAPITFNGALGTPSSGIVTNLTGTASININGTVGATTPGTGAFTTLSASSTVSGSGFSTYLASPPAIGGTVAAAGTFTTLTGNTSVTSALFNATGASGYELSGTTVLGIVATNFTTLSDPAGTGKIFLGNATANHANSYLANTHVFKDVASGAVQITLAAGLVVGPTGTDPGIGGVLATIYKSGTAPTAVSGAGPFLTGSASTLNNRMKVNLNGTDYWIPCSTTAF